MKTRRVLFELIMAIIWVWGAVWGVSLFNQYILMSLPLVVRMIVMLLIYLVIAFGPFIMALVARDRPAALGFSNYALGKQIICGVVLGIAMSLVLTLPFHLIGLSNWVNNGHQYTQLWQFAYEFIYCIAGVALTEEFIFRGFFFDRLSKLSSSKAFPVVLSSVLFGLFHVFAGVWIQVIATALIGLLFCVLRLKIKNCSTLSLILAHGIYDALISVWLAVFL